jgi:para-nitrobenzyl esterase
VADNKDTHVFKTSFGTIQGIKENGLIIAPHIRYASSERFGMPVALSTSDPSRKIPGKIPVCPQNIRPLLEKMIEITHIENFEVDESPQYLSITCPEKIPEGEKLPVIVWIHGGSYEVGCGTLPTTDPGIWVKEQNIIVVAVSYRLGLFGFLGNGESILPNLGLFDIIEALRWIKKHIASIGGDPGCITLFGQSSGGDAAAHLIAAEGVENLFHRLIIQSAPLGLRKGRKKMSAEFARKTAALRKETDLVKMVEGYKPLVPSLLKYGLKAGMPFGLQYGFAPLCKENEVESRWKQHAKKYDILIGMNDEETAFFLSVSEVINKYASKGLGKKLLRRSIRFTTEKIYGKPAKRFAENYAQAGGNVYLFRIYSRLKNNPLAAAHCIDLPLIFGRETAWKASGLIKDIPWSYIDQMGKQLRKIWADFARTGQIAEDADIPAILKIKKIKHP